ncbi:protein NLRC3-like isoform 2-T3 [Anableps anableps]
MDSAGPKAQVQAGSKSLVEHETSMDKNAEFKEQRSEQEYKMDFAEPEPQVEAESKKVVKRKSSMDRDTDYREIDINQHCSEILTGQSVPLHRRNLDSIFVLLEESIIKFVKNELKKIQKVLTEDGPECLASQNEKEEGGNSKNLFLNITLNFLRGMKEEELADNLQKKTQCPESTEEIKSKLKKKFQNVFDELAKAGNPTLLNQIYIPDEGTRGDRDAHQAASRNSCGPEISLTCENIFKALKGKKEPVRTVMTEGVAGIGKTILTQRFVLDWAENKANQDIYFLFPISFRELNVLKEKQFSLVELLHHYFSEFKEAEISRFEEFQVLFIFDGLDESRLPLDFHNNEILTDVTEATSVDVLLTNLIRGKLLPSARLWITTRPAAANQIPPECVDLVTEIRGFTDPQKEEYFQKRFKNDRQATKIISHIKALQSLNIMCNIPAICWITSTVLADVLKLQKAAIPPRTLTEVYIHLLALQTKVKRIKFVGEAKPESYWDPKSMKMIESLGKLAFEHLQKGNLIFYESDLTECGINVRAASVYSEVFPQIFREERGWYLDKMFCFVHLSVQEFLAALHVHLTFINSGVNLLDEQLTFLLPRDSIEKPKLTHLHQTAVDKALQSPNGHLDLFLRFLLGLSLPAAQTFLSGLLKQKRSSSQTNQEIFQYIKKLCENLSAEKSISLFYCLNELNDRSLVEEIQQRLSSGTLSTDKLSPAQWSALVFLLLTSEKDLNVFDLKKYSSSEEALLWLLPVVKASKTVLLDACNLKEKSFEALSSILSSESSTLRELDLSNNNLWDAGVKLLSVGLESPFCKLEVLRLSGCLITEEGCASLASALSSNPSYLRELDLSYNHPGNSGIKLLSAGLQNPDWRLETLRFL